MRFKQKFMVTQCQTPYYLYQGNWFQSNNKKMAIIFGGAVFVILITLAHTNYQQNSVKHYITNTTKSIFKITKTTCCTLYDKEIKCSSCAGESISNEISNLTQNMTGSFTLEISSIKFHNDTIPTNWLSNLNNVIITALKIYNVKLVDFKEISNNPFQLNTLWIVNSIKVLSKENFIGLKLIEILEIRFDSFTSDTQIEINAFDSISASLKSFQIQNTLKDNEAAYFFGQDLNFPQLVSIDMSSNKLTQIDKDTFKSVSNVLGLYLSDNRIEKIHRDAFNHMNNLCTLYLTNNDLTTIEEGTFDFAKQFSNNAFQIYLGGNNLICNCSLEWLKQFVIDYPVFVPEPICKDQDHIIKNITDVEFNCSDSTTILPQSTTDLAIVTTSPPKTFLLSCSDELKFSEAFKKTYIDDKVVVKNETVLRFNFYTLDTQPLQIHVQIEGQINNYNLIWFNSKNREDTDCLFLSTNNVTFDGLVRENTYTMCVMENGVPTVSPYDCFGLYIPESTERLALFRNEDLPELISISAGVLIGTIILTGIIIFFCIRQNPRLIKGNKKILIVKNLKKDNSCPKARKQDLIYAPSSFATTGILTRADTPGYLTPRERKYTEIKYRPPLIRTDLQHPSYLNSINSPYYSYVHSKNEFVFNKNMTEDVVSDLYEAPPLPPMNNNANQDNTIYSIS